MIFEVLVTWFMYLFYINCTTVNKRTQKVNKSAMIKGIALSISAFCSSVYFSYMGLPFWMVLWSKKGPPRMCSQPLESCISVRFFWHKLGKTLKNALNVHQCDRYICRTQCSRNWDEIACQSVLIDVWIQNPNKYPRIIINALIRSITSCHAVQLPPFLIKSQHHCSKLPKKALRKYLL